jgi:hypothetical protein
MIPYISLLQAIGRAMDGFSCIWSTRLKRFLGDVMITSD